MNKLLDLDFIQYDDETEKQIAELDMGEVSTVYHGPYPTLAQVLTVDYETSDMRAELPQWVWMGVALGIFSGVHGGRLKGNEAKASFLHKNVDTVFLSQSLAHRELKKVQHKAFYSGFLSWGAHAVLTTFLFGAFYFQTAHNRKKSDAINPITAGILTAGISAIPQGATAVLWSPLIGILFGSMVGGTIALHRTLNYYVTPFADNKSLFTEHKNLREKTLKKRHLEGLTVLDTIVNDLETESVNKELEAVKSETKEI